jgi:hypothetical protein
MQQFTMKLLRWSRAAAGFLPALLFSCVALFLAPALPARASSPPAVPPGQGVSLGTLTIGTTTYRHVKLLSVNARTIVIVHSGGMASIRLRDLSPELQARFGYNPAAELAANEALDQANATAAQQQTKNPPGQTLAHPAGSDSRFDDLLQRFGQKPEIRSEVDLRPRFLQLELGVKDQGRRPSCAVFAVVSALEYQNAEFTGQAEKFSEEYLIWATRKTLNRISPPAETSDPGKPNLADDADEGFSLSDVVLALRAYGIPPQSAMPNAGYSKMTDIQEPSAELINQAHTHRRVFVHLIPGRDPAARVDNIILALNAGMPVAIGLRWPNYHAVRAGFLSEQAPMAGSAHAVALVGYQNSGGQAEGTVFIFKNSWGPAWGEAGYGRATYRYLRANLLDGALLEVQQP